MSLSSLRFCECQIVGISPVDVAESRIMEYRRLHTGALQRRQVKQIALNTAGGRNVENVDWHL